MKRLLLIFSFLLTAGLVLAQQSGLKSFLKSQPEIKSVEQIESNDFFNATYTIFVEQPLDHTAPGKGSFLQRVIVADKAVDSPVVVITEGYSADYAIRKNYINELSPMLGSNQICIEHRYFGESWPVPLNWDYLTVRNAAADHHAVIELMKRYYSGKWVSTGISKGGQTVVYHRWLYPNDVDVSVPYVCPLNFGVEDGRHEPFIAEKTGTPEMRQKVKNFQLYILKNRELYQPMLEQYCKQNSYTFRISMNEVYDYTVLEYSFALWQYGIPTDEIPALDSAPDKIFAHLMRVSSPSYLSVEDQEGIKSFFVQAARELGYYGYDTKPFKEYLSLKSTKGYIYRIFIPEGVEVKYDRRMSKQVHKFIFSTDAKILFIYGAWDPWSAPAFEVPEKDNMLRIMKPNGSHGTRINNLPGGQKKLVKLKLEDWLGIEVNIDN